MQLSLYEQYYVRKLLRHYIKHLNYPIFGVAVCTYFHANLNQLLRRIETGTYIIQDLRALIRFHQSVKETTSSASQQIEIEQKILWMLGLKFLVLVANTSTVIISESSTSRFKFVLNGQIHCGICYSNELYGMCLKFGAELDFSASRLLIMLINRSIPFVLTASDQQHTIWVSLRSPACHSFLALPAFPPHS